MTLKAILFTGLLLLFLPQPGLKAQPSAVLDAYIRTALTQSPLIQKELLRLQEKRIGEEAAAKLFLPEVRLGSTYTLAQGGRRIEFPVGDLINPVYSTLNQLTQSNAFPQIANVNEQFLPNNFYDLRFRVTQPILNAEIQLNKKIRGLQVSAQEIQIAVVQRSLVKEVKIAYFQYIQTLELEGIYRNTLNVLREQRRVNESLIRNGKAQTSVLQRDDSEIAKIENLLAQAQIQSRTAAALFNYLLFRDPAAPIDVDPIFRLDVLEDEWKESRREELTQLLEFQKLQDMLVELEDAKRKPTLGAQLDLGSQNFDFKWGGYALLGISFEMPIWNANRYSLKARQAQLEAQVVGAQIQEFEQALQLEAIAARNNLEASKATLTSYRAQLDSARRYLQDTSRRYREGAALYLELLDAQTQVLNLETQQVLTKYEVLIRQAELERALAAFRL